MLSFGRIGILYVLCFYLLTIYLCMILQLKNEKREESKSMNDKNEKRLNKRTRNNVWDLIAKCYKPDGSQPTTAFLETRLNDQSSNNNNYTNKQEKLPLQLDSFIHHLKEVYLYDQYVAFFLSAFEIEENERNIYFVGVEKYSRNMNSVKNMSIYVSCKNERNYRKVDFERKMLPEHYERDFRSVLFSFKTPELCQFQSFDIYIQVHNSSNMTSVTVNRKSDRADVKFTVCLGPLRLTSNMSVYRLIEWIEFQRIVGANHFYVYVTKCSVSVKDVLNFYQREGVVTCIRWDIPESLDIHNYGQMATLNDCLYRSKLSSTYLVNLDLDEFLIPRRQRRSWNDVVKADEAIEYQIGSSVFGGPWIRINNNVDVNMYIRNFRLRTLRNVHRRSYVFSNGNRTKYIAKTDCAAVLGIHAVHAFSNYAVNSPTLYVDPEHVLVHHYRRHTKATAVGYQVKDLSALRYVKQLVDNIKLVFDELMKIQFTN